MRQSLILRSSALALCGMGLLAVAGCGGQNRPALAQVHGRVTLNGKPLANAIVAFHPEGGGRESSGVTDDNGEYVLKYIRDELGGTVGKNSVRVVKQAENVPERYNKQTTLSFEVKPGDNDIPLPLTSP